MEPLNRLAIALVDEALDFADELSIGATELDNGATLLDFGIDHDGGVEAGLLLAEIASAGLATVQTRMGSVRDRPIPHVEVATDQPDLALLASMHAGWELAVGDFQGLVGGPGRAIVAEEHIFDVLGYAEAAEYAVLTVESDQRPGAAVAEAVADRSGMEPETIFLVVVPAASVAGGVLAAARAPELACHRLLETGYDPRDIVSVVADAPIPPIAATEAEAVARGTDTVAYGARASATVRSPGEFEAIHSTATDRYDRPFARVFDDLDRAYDRVEPDAFGPAAVTIDVHGGPTISGGSRNDEVLAESFAL